MRLTITGTRAEINTWIMETGKALGAATGGNTISRAAMTITTPSMPMEEENKLHNYVTIYTVREQEGGTALGSFDTYVDAKRFVEAQVKDAEGQCGLTIQAMSAFDDGLVIWETETPEGVTEERAWLNDGRFEKLAKGHPVSFTWGNRKTLAFYGLR